MSFRYGVFILIKCSEPTTPFYANCLLPENWQNLSWIREGVCEQSWWGLCLCLLFSPEGGTVIEPIERFLIFWTDDNRLVCFLRVSCFSPVTLFSLLCLPCQYQFLAFFVFLAIVQLSWDLPFRSEWMSFFASVVTIQPAPVFLSQSHLWTTNCLLHSRQYDAHWLLFIFSIDDKKVILHLSCPKNCTGCSMQKFLQTLRLAPGGA